MATRRLGSLGEFEHLVLLATLWHADGVFGSDIGRKLEERAERRVSRGALYATLARLEQKGYVSWSIEEGGPDRGGHPRRRFVVTRTGRQVLREYRRAVENLVVGIEELL
jgi:PadR family transcriptional regulator, regulatory protein PadR